MNNHFFLIHQEIQTNELHIKEAYSIVHIYIQMISGVIEVRYVRNTVWFSRDSLDSL